jgi:hypothetical protein
VPFAACAHEEAPLPGKSSLTFFSQADILKPW